jgi:hypothetical protein
MPAANIQYEIADRTRAISVGGIGAAHLLVKRLGLDQAGGAASNREGAAVTQRHNVHRMADANKAFAHFAW